MHHLSSEQAAIRAKSFHRAGSFVEFAESEINRSLLDRFQDYVGKIPNQVAVKTRRHSLTYAELDRRSNRVAHALLASNLDRESPVGLFFDNGASFVIASLAAIKAGKIQVALESAAPRSRSNYLLEHSGASLLLTDDLNVARLQVPHGVRVMNIDEIDDSPGSASQIDLKQDQVLAIDYTSGSTGRPKGMMWDHRGLRHVIARHTNTSHICRHDRLVMFRASVRAYLSVLLNGGTFYPVDLGYEPLADLAHWLIHEEITIYRSAVSTFRSLMNVVAPEQQFPAMRLILLFGEPAYFRDVEAYRAHFTDHCLLSTSLGCNEMDDYSYFFVDRNSPVNGGVLPGGYPVADVDVLLLDETGRQVDRDGIGEIAVRARYHPLGYWREPDLNQAAFQADPDTSSLLVYRTGDLGRLNSDGCLFHAGRKDFQLKIRGYRVDVGEVEAALLKLNGVKAAAVTGHNAANGDTLLIAYIVPSKDSDPPSASQLRRSLTGELPDFMIPTRFIVVDRMPLTASGKIDRRALPSPDGMRPRLDTPFVAPRTPVEETLAAIWGEVLGLKTVGVLDDFLELGGDSLRATQVIARLTNEFRVRPPLRTMLEARTVEELASVVLQSQAESIGARELEELLFELDGLSDDEARARFNGKGNGRHSKSRLVLVVPFHNEDRHLPWLIHSLREQDVRNIPIVFIDNGSTDGSAGLVHACEEVKAGKWLALEEKRVGKIRAMRTATEFCRERFNCEQIGFLDSDSYLGDSSWIGNSLEIVGQSGERFGYTYSPLAYFGLDKWPNFKTAYLRYSDILQGIVRNVGWLANGQGFVCAADTLAHYFENADLTTEVDLRCSLLALLMGKEAFLNLSILMSSGRRMTANAKNFYSWCFYERDFYSKKDINTRQKLDLKISDRVEDLEAGLVRYFFKRRALKIACRHLMPLAIFNEDLNYLERINRFLGVDISRERLAGFGRFRNSDTLLTDRFEDMIKEIEQHSLTIEMARGIEDMMIEQYDSHALPLLGAGSELRSVTRSPAG